MTETKGTIEHHKSGGMSFTGHGVSVFQAAVLASGLRLYAKTGMKPNRMYTPTNMLKTVGAITGKTYKRGQFEQAASDLDAWKQEQLGELEIVDNR